MSDQCYTKAYGASPVQSGTRCTVYYCSSKSAISRLDDDSIQKFDTLLEQGMGRGLASLELGKKDKILHFDMVRKLKLKLGC